MHPLRVTLHNELHARPSIYFDGPACVYHLAFLSGGAGYSSLLDRLVGSGTQLPHGFIERDGARFKWERHGEFLTITAVVPTTQPHLLWPPFPSILSELMTAYAGDVISAVQLMVTVAEGVGDLSAYGFQDPAGSQIGGQSAELWSDFVLSDEGICRVLMVNKSLNTYRLGRMVRRVLEQETYRMMALLGLPDAQMLADELEMFEKVLSNLTERTAKLDRGETRSLLDEIASLSTDVTRRVVGHQHRLAATAAYANLVSERIAELRETHAGECQRFGVFIERRFRPAVRYSAAVQERLSRLTDGVAHLNDLLQARAQVELEAQNTQILESLNQRAQTQIKIQKAVEGVSVIAITYYLLSLLKLIYQGGEALGLVLSSQVAVLTCIPVTILVLWHSRHKINKVSDRSKS